MTPRTLFVCILFGTILHFQFGCAGQRSSRADEPLLTLTVEQAQSLDLVDGHTGASMGWDQLVDRLSDADIVVIGERHDDGPGHGFQRAVVRAVADRNGSATALAMEMLERDEFFLIEDYMDGLIDESTFARLTESTSWAGAGSWDAWYQPIIDEVKKVDGRVVGANAPRRYVRLARAGRLDELAEMDPDRRSLFEPPAPLEDDAYRARFWSLAEHARAGDDVDPADIPKIAADDPGLVSFFRSQSVWDATMGTSTARAWLEEDIDCVVLLIGQFHVDFNGGTLQTIRRVAPGARILTISMEHRDEEEEIPGEGVRADVIVITDSFDE